MLHEIQATIIEQVTEVELHSSIYVPSVSSCTTVGFRGRECV